jgi:hypothetical protein
MPSFLLTRIRGFAAPLLIGGFWCGFWWAFPAPLSAHIMSMSSGHLVVEGSVAEYELRMPLYEIVHLEEPEKSLLENFRLYQEGREVSAAEASCRANPDEGVYLELGAAPVVAVTDDLLVTVPLRLGLSLKDYYEDSTGGGDLFGFFAIGARTSLDLCDENSLFGPWKLETSLDIYILGDTAKLVNNGDSAEVVLGVNLNLSF